MASVVVVEASEVDPVKVEVIMVVAVTLGTLMVVIVGDKLGVIET